MAKHNFKKLQIWMDSMELISESYAITSTFPDFERFGLRSQMNRCAVSIASNIAEGSSKRTNKHFIVFLETSLGSAYEWETQLIVSYDQKYINKDDFLRMEEQIQVIQKKTSNFIERISL